MSLLSRLRYSKKRGFTLIESLAVIAIIGILLSLSIYTITQAQRQARDTVRKSDVSAIAQGFEARALDKTCTDQTALNIYPGEAILISEVPPAERMLWHPVEDVSGSGIVDRCNPFSTYLSSIPNDPKILTNKYHFNLAAKSDARGQHYRIAAKLEKRPTDDQWKEICRQSDVWYGEFIGEKYNGCGGYIDTYGGGIMDGMMIEEDPIDPGGLGGFLHYIVSPAYACTFDTVTGTWGNCAQVCDGLIVDSAEWDANNCRGMFDDPPGDGEDSAFPYNYYIGR